MKEILFEWNSWWNSAYKFTGIERDSLKDILPWIARKEIVAITGVRRAGKTTLMFEIISHIINSNSSSAKNIFFIKADDDRVANEKLIDTTLDEYRKWLNPSGTIYLFIDEIQELPDWQKTVKRIYDLNKDIKIFISGSNASIIKEHLSSVLAGRFAYFEVFPFSFSEFLRAKDTLLAKKTKKKDEFMLMGQKNNIRHLLIEYASYGSFPEVVLAKDEKIKRELAEFYFDSIFYRDIIKRHSIRNPAKLEKLVKYFLQNAANLANFTKIAKTISLTTDSVVEYTKALEDAYLIFYINLFEFSYKKQIINPKKIYCVDIGIRNAKGFKFSEDIGRIYENIVFITLRQKYKEIFYWKSKYECDFIIKEGKKLSAMQVCHDINTSKEREVTGLLDAMKEFNLNEGIIITDDYEAAEKIDKKKIKFMPLWKWLLTY